jgi:urease accessory protein
MARGISLRLLLALVGGVVAGTVLSASPLGAHAGGGAASFAGGVSHPIGGPDHLLAMVAVGVLAVVGARQDRRFLWAAPAMFVAAMVAGGAAGMAGVVAEPFELVIVGSVLALGVAIGAASWSAASDHGPLVLVAALGLVGVAGLAHGHAHGVEAAAGTDAAAYVVGFVVATVALHAGGALVAAAVRSRPALVTALAVAITGAGASLIG